MIHKLLLKFGVIGLLSAMSISCNDDYILRQQNDIVVEGWIEDEGFPVVILTKTINITKEYQSMDSLAEYIVKWAKVTVSDGNQSVVLTGKYAAGYFPPYIYTTSRFCGEAGKTYTLTVDYLDFHATATTTILEPHKLRGLTVDKCLACDSLYQISVRFNNDAMKHNYYQIFTRVGRKKHQYLAAYLGTIDGDVLQPESMVPVFRGRDVSTHKYSPYYSINDTVAVKIAHIDEAAYHFWYDYSRNLTTGDNMFFASQANIRSNINGGIGYWCGMGTVTEYVCIRDSVSQH